MRTTSKVSPFLWFDRDAEEAAAFYVSLLPNSAVQHVTRAGDGPAAPAFLVEFTLDGVAFKALNGGPGHPFSDATSIHVECEDQAEVDRLYGALTEGGAPGPCGWCTDRYGLSWQVIPKALPRLLGDPDPARARRATEAMMRMTKIDVAALEQAADGVTAGAA